VKKGGREMKNFKLELGAGIVIVVAADKDRAFKLIELEEMERGCFPYLTSGKSPNDLIEISMEEGVKAYFAN
jgi:hypothetical protein